MPTGRYRHGKAFTGHQKENRRYGSILHNVTWTATIKKPLELQGASRTGVSRPTAFLAAKIQQFLFSATFLSKKIKKAGTAVTGWVGWNGRHSGRRRPQGGLRAWASEAARSDSGAFAFGTKALRDMTPRRLGRRVVGRWCRPRPFGYFSAMRKVTKESTRRVQQPDNSTVFEIFSGC